MKVFKMEFTLLDNWVKRPTKEWKTNTYMEHLVELPSGQRVFMSDKELKKLNEKKND